MRRWSKAAVLALGLLLFGAQSAAASPTVNWKAVSTNANWHCADYRTHPETYGPWVDHHGINFKACTVVNANGDAQAVLVVQNSELSGSWYLEKGRVVFQSQLGGDVWCAASPLGAGATRGCYGPTVHVGTCDVIQLAPYVELKINGHTYGAYGKGYVLTPC